MQYISKMEIKKYKQFLESKIPTTIELPKDIIKISNAYTNAGKEIFVVGGAVRDFILGKVSKDWDLVTNALPNESKEILKDFNVSDEQGKNFGVLRVFTEDEPTGYEIASYRRDISGGRDTKGDDQKVEIGGDVTIEDDCNRRDLSMNALFYDIKNKEIVDLVGGIDDINHFGDQIRTVDGIDANRAFVNAAAEIMVPINIDKPFLIRIIDIRTPFPVNDYAAAFGNVSGNRIAVNRLTAVSEAQLRFVETFHDNPVSIIVGSSGSAFFFGFRIHLERRFVVQLNIGIAEQTV